MAPPIGGDQQDVGVKHLMAERRRRKSTAFLLVLALALFCSTPDSPLSTRRRLFCPPASADLWRRPLRDADADRPPDPETDWRPTRGRRWSGPLGSDLKLRCFCQSSFIWRRLRPPTHYLPLAAENSRLVPGAFISCLQNAV